MRAMIRLEKMSSKNRAFVDALLRVLAVELNVGSKELNRELEVECYASTFDTGADNIGLNVAKRRWVRIGDKLSARCMAEIDRMLADGALEGCCDRIKISDYIIANSDLTDCHLTALNEMELTNYHRRWRS